MCGIAGFFSFENRFNQDDLVKMTNRIAHRGPDARGAWYHDELALGHNRLSILDLSEDGKQPMHFNNFSIVFNGEIYNYKEIRSELSALGHTFTSDSDTEVILHLYEEFGEALFSNFSSLSAAREKRLSEWGADEDGDEDDDADETEEGRSDPMGLRQGRRRLRIHDGREPARGLSHRTCRDPASDEERWRPHQRHHRPHPHLWLARGARARR